MNPNRHRHRTSRRAFAALRSMLNAPSHPALNRAETVQAAKRLAISILTPKSPKNYDAMVRGIGMSRLQSAVIAHTYHRAFLVLKLVGDISR